MNRSECKLVTKKAFKDAKRQGYVSVINRQKYMLRLTDKGTSLVPVCIKDKKEIGKR